MILTDGEKVMANPMSMKKVATTHGTRWVGRESRKETGTEQTEILGLNINTNGGVFNNHSIICDRERIMNDTLRERGEGY